MAHKAEPIAALGARDISETLPNSMLDRMQIVERVPGDPESRIEVPMLSFWLQTAGENTAYRNVTWELVQLPLPAELAEILRQPMQPVFIDSVTARWLHRRDATMDWQLPLGPRKPPRLMAISVSNKVMTGKKLQKMGGKGMGPALTNITFAAFVASFQTENRI